MDTATLKSQITNTTAIITALNAAILASPDATVIQYSVDTGQFYQSTRRL